MMRILMLGLLATAVPALAQPDIALQAELLQLMERDQAGRLEIEALEKELGPEAPRVKALWDEQREIDKQNLERLRQIVAERGWPGQSLVGARAAMGAFLIVQHADLDAQREYLPIIRAAAEAGELQGQAVAFLEDRVLLAEGRKQVYGTQVKRNASNGQFEPLPIEDEANVDARRAARGMSPLEEYLRNLSR